MLSVADAVSESALVLVESSAVCVIACVVESTTVELSRVNREVLPPPMPTAGTLPFSSPFSLGTVASVGSTTVVVAAELVGE